MSENYTNEAIPSYNASITILHAHTIICSFGSISVVRVPDGVRDLLLLHNDNYQTGSGAHLSDYPRDKKGSFQGDKVAGA
jgi:hypothetical protein